MPECMNIENGGQMITQKPTQIKIKKRMIVKPKKVKKAILLQRFGASHTRCALAIVTIEQCYAYGKKVKCFMGSKRERKMRI